MTTTDPPLCAKCGKPIGNPFITFEVDGRPVVHAHPECVLKPERVPDLKELVKNKRLFRADDAEGDE